MSSGLAVHTAQGILYLSSGNFIVFWEVGGGTQRRAFLRLHSTKSRLISSSVSCFRMGLSQNGQDTPGPDPHFSDRKAYKVPRKDPPEVSSERVLFPCLPNHHANILHKRLRLHFTSFCLSKKRLLFNPSFLTLPPSLLPPFIFFFHPCLSGRLNLWFCIGWTSMPPLRSVTNPVTLHFYLVTESH